MERASRSAAAIVAVRFAFAFTQIDFATRQRTYEIKRNELGGIIDEPNYFEPKKTEIFEKLRVIPQVEVGGY